MRFVYTRRGGPLLDWSGVTPPYPTRAGETRSLGDFYPTHQTSSALRRYGGIRGEHGSAVAYEHHRALGGEFGYAGAGYHPPPGMGAFNLPRPGAPEVVEDYESPQPGAAIVHLGNGYMPEGAARKYGQTMLSADAPAPAPKQFDMGLLRKASAVAAGYHGVKRNNGSIFWGLMWAAAAFISPLYGTLVPAFAVAQGFAQPKPKSNPAGRKRRKKRSPAARKKLRRKLARVRRRVAAADWSTANLRKVYRTVKRSPR